MKEFCVAEPHMAILMSFVKTRPTYADGRDSFVY